MKGKPFYSPGDKIGGRFLIHDVKMGGMGEVYLCLDQKDEQPYAIKTFSNELISRPDVRNAIKREAFIWASLESHPNIVRLFFMDVIDNRPFLFLEWIRGDNNQDVDLNNYLNSNNVNVQTALGMAIDICNALVYANGKIPGFVHKDIKPGNILISSGNLAKLTDFGLTNIAQEPPTSSVNNESENVTHLFQVTNRAGTPYYMAPEQWLGKTVDARADVYAIGCVLFEILGKKRLFDAWNFKELQDKHLNQRPPVQQLANIVPQSVIAIIDSCLGKKPESRYQTPQELLNELQVVFKQLFGSGYYRESNEHSYDLFDRTNRARIYGYIGLFEKALHEYEHVLSLDPPVELAAMAHSNRGSLYRDTGMYDQALKDFNEAISLTPNRADLFNNRGNSLTSLGRYSDALKDFEKALSFDSDNPEYFVNRSVVYANMSKFDEAFRDCAQALIINARNTHAYVMLGTMLRNLDRAGEAHVCLDAAVKLGDPEAQHLASMLSTELAMKYFPNTGSFEDALQMANNLPYLSISEFLVIAEATFNKTKKEMGIMTRDIEKNFRQKLVWLSKAEKTRAKPQTTPFDEATDKLRYSNSIEELQSATNKYPFMLDRGYLDAIENALLPMVPKYLLPSFRKRVEWLRQLISEAN